MQYIGDTWEQPSRQKAAYALAKGAAEGVAMYELWSSSKSSPTGDVREGYLWIKEACSTRNA